MSKSTHKKITAPDPKGQESGTAILKYNFKNYEDYKALRSALCDFLNFAETDINTITKNQVNIADHIGEYQNLRLHQEKVYPVKVRLFTYF